MRVGGRANLGVVMLLAVEAAHPRELGLHGAQLLEVPEVQAAARSGKPGARSR